MKHSRPGAGAAALAAGLLAGASVMAIRDRENGLPEWADEGSQLRAIKEKAGTTCCPTTRTRRRHACREGQPGGRHGLLRRHRHPGQEGRRDRRLQARRLGRDLRRPEESAATGSSTVAPAGLVIVDAGGVAEELADLPGLEYKGLVGYSTRPRPSSAKPAPAATARAADGQRLGYRVLQGAGQQRTRRSCTPTSRRQRDRDPARRRLQRHWSKYKDKANVAFVILATRCIVPNVMARWRRTPPAPGKATILYQLCHPGPRPAVRVRPLSEGGGSLPAGRVAPREDGDYGRMAEVKAFDRYLREAQRSTNRMSAGGPRGLRAAPAAMVFAALAAAHGARRRRPAGDHQDHQAPAGSAARSAPRSRRRNPCWPAAAPAAPAAAARRPRKPRPPVRRQAAEDHPLRSVQVVDHRTPRR